MVDGPIPEFREFRRKVRRLALRALETNESEFVRYFREAYERTHSLDRAAAESRQLLRGAIPQWLELLTLTLDVEYAIDKVRRSLGLLGRPVPDLGGDWNEGAWTVYQFDHWGFQVHAWLERLERLVKRACRQLIRPSNNQWAQVEQRLGTEIAAMRAPIEKVRHPLAHGGGVGVTGPAEEHLWEPGLILIEDMDVVSPGMYSTMGRYRQRWHSMLFDVTLSALARSEAIFRELNQHIVSGEAERRE